MTPNEPYDPVGFGRRLRALREATGFSQAELAEELGVASSTIPGWENAEALSRGSAKMRGPGSDALIKLAELFDVEPRWLLTGQGKRRDLEPPSSAVAVVDHRVVRQILAARTRSDVRKLLRKGRDGEPPSVFRLHDGRLVGVFAFALSETTEFVGARELRRISEQCDRHLQRLVDEL